MAALPDLTGAPRRWFIYTRVSSDPGHDELGVRRQEKACREFAQRHGGRVVQVFPDDDKSAYSGKRRPQYEAMLERLEAGEADGIIAWHPDRLHRSPRELESFIDLIERTGTMVRTVQGGDYDLATATGRAMARTIGAWSRHESEHKSERIRAKVIELREQGKYAHGLRRRPFGYRQIEEGKAPLELVEDEAAVICELAERYLAGHSLRAMVRDLEERGVSTVSGARWKPSTVRGMLTNPLIAGLRRAPGSVRLEPAPWPAIIDEATHHRLAAYAARSSAAHPTRAARRHLLSGLAVCGACGGRMQGSPTHAGLRYICANPDCRKVSIDGEQADQIIANRMFALVDGPDFGRRLARAAGRPAGLAEQRRRLEERFEVLADMLAEDELDRAGYVRARGKVQAQLDALREQDREEAVTTPLSRWARGGLREAWDGLPLDQRRAVIGAVAERIVIEPKPVGTRHQFDPERVVIAGWRV